MAQPTFKKVRQTPASQEAFVQSLDPILRKKTGRGVVQGYDVASNAPFTVGGRRQLNPQGIEGSQIAQAQMPVAPVPLDQPEVLGATAPLTIEGFLQKINSESSGGDNSSDTREQIQKSTGKAYSVATSQDGGTIYSDGKIRYNDGTVRQGDPSAKPIASLNDGSILYSDNSVKRQETAQESQSYIPQGERQGMASMQGNLTLNNDFSLSPNNQAYTPFYSGQGYDPLIQNITQGQRSASNITQAYGNYNPAIEPTASGRNVGLDIGTGDLPANKQVPIALPEDVEVVQTYRDDGTRFGEKSGHLGYGNSVLVRIPRTGEMLRFSHLSTDTANLKSGQVIPAGSQLGVTGNTGNTYGSHLDLEYYNKEGKGDDPGNFSFQKKTTGTSNGDITGFYDPRSNSFMNTRGQGVNSPYALNYSPATGMGAVAQPQALLASNLFQDAEKARNAQIIIDAFKEQGITDPKVLAYALATVQHETAGTFRPIEEYGGREQARRLGYSGGENYYGRGYIQLTHDYNYKDIGDKIGVDLVNNPELALQPEVAAKIMATFFKDRGVDKLVSEKGYEAGRGPINGTDQADKIANIARSFETNISSQPIREPSGQSRNPSSNELPSVLGASTQRQPSSKEYQPTSIVSKAESIPVLGATVTAGRDASQAYEKAGRAVNAPELGVGEYGRGEINAKEFASQLVSGIGKAFKLPEMNISESIAGIDKSKPFDPTAQVSQDSQTPIVSRSSSLVGSREVGQKATASTASYNKGLQGASLAGTFSPVNSSTFKKTDPSILGSGRAVGGVSGGGSDINRSSSLIQKQADANTPTINVGLVKTTVSNGSKQTPAQKIFSSVSPAKKTSSGGSSSKSSSSKKSSSSNNSSKKSSSSKNSSSSSSSQKKTVNSSSVKKSTGTLSSYKSPVPSKSSGSSNSSSVKKSTGTLSNYSRPPGSSSSSKSSTPAKKSTSVFKKAVSAIKSIFKR